MRNEVRLLIALCILSLSLVACGGPDPAVAPALTDDAPELTVTLAPTGAPTVVPTERPSETPTLAAEPTQPPPLPTPAGPQASIVELLNRVDAHPLPAGDWEPAQLDMLVFLGGEVWAQEASTARLDLAGDAIRVAPNTIFSLSQPNADTLKLELDAGQVWLNIEGLEPGQNFEVETPNAVAAVRGTRFSVRADAQQGTIVSTQVGTVTLQAETKAVTVTAGLESWVPPGMKPSLPYTLSVQEQLYWGMGWGDDLAVVLPAVAVSEVMTIEGRVSNPQFSPDGQSFAGYYYYSQGDDHTYGNFFYDLAAGAFVTDVLPADAGGIHFDPDNERVAYQYWIEGKTQICVLDPAVGEADCFGGDAFYGWPFWSPDGQWLLYYTDLGRSDGVPNLWRSRPDGSELIQLTDREQAVGSPTWSPDNTQIAFVEYDRRSKEPGDLWLMNADGSEQTLLLPDIHPHERAQWSPGGDWLAVRGYESGLWLVPTNGEPAVMLPNSEGGRCTNFGWAPTESGWPLYAYRADGESEQTRLGFVTAPDRPFTVMLDGASWGPLWTGDGTAAFFGVVDESGAIPVTTVRRVEMLPALYR